MEALDVVTAAVAAAVALLSLVHVLLACRYPTRNTKRDLGSVRPVLWLLLVAAHLAELGDAALRVSHGRGHGGSCWPLMSPCLALVAATGLQLISLPPFLAAALYAAVSGARLYVFLHLLNEGLDFQHVRLGATGAAAGCAAALALSYLLHVAYFQIKHRKMKDKTLDDSNVGYRHLTSSFFSKAMFLWLVPLLRTGYSSPLEVEDLGQLPDCESTETQYNNFHEIYTKEKEAASKGKRAPSLWKCYFQSCWQLFLLGGIFKLLGDLVGFVAPLGISVIIQYVASLLDSPQVINNEKVYYPTWGEFINNGYIMGVIVFISAIAQGTLSQCSTHLVTVEGIHLKGSLQALVYSKALKLCVWTISEHREEIENDSVLKENGLSVHMSSVKPNQQTEKNHAAIDVGTITNLMSEDAFNVMTFFWIGHYVWAIPVKIAVLMYLLYTKLGMSAIIGAAFCIITMTPLQFIIGKKMSNNSKLITEVSDERLRKINEVLQGIKLLKLYGWECLYGEKISKIRQNELKYLDNDSLYWAVMTFLTHASSVLVTLVTFGIYYLVEYSELTPDSVFAGLALFNQLTVPLFIFPVTVPIIISAMISTKRLENFLALPETSSCIPPDSDSEKNDITSDAHAVEAKSICSQYQNVKAVNTSKKKPQRSDSVFSLGGIPEREEEENEETEENEASNEVVVPKSNEIVDEAVFVKSGTFSWSAEVNACSLTIKDVFVPKGKLTIIVGQVGSGKTSFLSALLGEMHIITGEVKWSSNSSVAYAAQKPWLLNATLRENILFGQPYRPRRYGRVIAACALQPDIEILPGKDLTEIGEKGISLSGGQKQRIAIARAMYSWANVVILDDPLSALDYQVGQQVFDDGIKKLLLKQKRTVILVTHRLQLLSQAQKIIAMEKGEVQAQGSLQEIEEKNPNLVKTWQAMISREALEEKNVARGHTARERWHLIKLVSRFGVQFKQRNIKFGVWQAEEGSVAGVPQFVPFRKRLGTYNSSRHLTHDLPLPIDECENDFVGQTERRPSVIRRGRAATTLDHPPRHKTILRMSSLQANRTVENIPFPVVRQHSSPSIHQGPFSVTSHDRQQVYTLDTARHGNILQKIFSIPPQRSISIATNDTSSIIKEKNVLKKLMSSSTIKSVNPSAEENYFPAKRLLSATSSISEDFEDDDNYDDGEDIKNSRLMSEEEREYGKIPKKLYLVYLRACGVSIGVSCLFFTFSWQGLRIYTDYWLSEWTNSGNGTSADNIHKMDKPAYYLIIYGILSGLSILLSFSSNAAGQYAGSKARRKLHDEMLNNMLLCPLKFFETTPIGRIINRFSADMGVIDKKIATSIQRLLQFLLLCVSAIFVNAIVTPWFLLASIPICGIYYVVQRFYRCSSRELQRLDSITRSPIFSHFSETLGGLATIRAFNHQRRFMDVLFTKMDAHTNTFLIMNAGNRWLGIALDYLGGVIVFIAIVASLVTASLYPNMITSSLVGLAVNYTLLVPIYLNWVVKFLTDMEMYMSAVERVHQYSLTPTEDYRKNGMAVPKTWPESGAIEFKNVSLRYDANREPVINNLNIQIPAGQKVGICGRTGSGKSSLVMALFQMVDIFEGTIYIDGVNIKKIPLRILRSRLSIIPQDVIMFSGTIRENLDPSEQYTDDELWKCLELAQLKDIVANLQGKLDAEVREGGENLSAGERQLFCLARAILHKAACLVMDEATSSIDPGTEKSLLAAASRAFAGRTVITIAHRLRSILDYDRVIVLDAGRVVEDGTPNQLLNRSMGIFSSMLRAAEDGGLSVN